MQPPTGQLSLLTQGNKTFCFSQWMWTEWTHITLGSGPPFACPGIHSSFFSPSLLTSGFLSTSPQHRTFHLISSSFCCPQLQRSTQQLDACRVNRPHTECSCTCCTQLRRVVGLCVARGLGEWRQPAAPTNRGLKIHRHWQAIGWEIFFLAGVKGQRYSTAAREAKRDVVDKSFLASRRVRVHVPAKCTRREGVGESAAGVHGDRNRYLNVTDKTTIVR